MKSSVISLSEYEINEVCGGISKNTTIGTIGVASLGVIWGIEGIGWCAVSTLTGIATFGGTLMLISLRDGWNYNNLLKAMDKAVLGWFVGAAKACGGYVWKNYGSSFFQKS